MALNRCLPYRHVLNLNSTTYTEKSEIFILKSGLKKDQCSNQSDSKVIWGNVCDRCLEMTLTDI